MIKTKKILAQIFLMLVIGIPFTGFTELGVPCSMANTPFSQANDLLKLKDYFEGDLKSWTNSFYNFKLADFRIVETIEFSQYQQKDFNYYNDFLSVYKPILTYSPDSFQFIDIYSVQLNIQ